jgi:hypothetical protein
MISQQQKDYVQGQVNIGVVKEDIIRVLVSQGWSEQEISEAFSATHEEKFTPPTPNSASPVAKSQIVSQDPLRLFLISLVGLISVFQLSVFAQRSDINFFTCNEAGVYETTHLGIGSCIWGLISAALVLTLGILTVGFFIMLLAHIINRLDSR